MSSPSNTSDISDKEWTAGGFPCRDMIGERYISDNIGEPEPNIAILNSHITRDNKKNRYFRRADNKG